MFHELCGDETLKNLVLVTNMWGRVPREIGEARENEISRFFFKPALDKGAQMIRHYDTPQSAHDILRRIMVNHPVVLQTRRELVDERETLIDPAPGDLPLKHSVNRSDNIWWNWGGVGEEMMESVEDEDEKTRLELEEEMGRV